MSDYEKNIVRDTGVNTQSTFLETYTQWRENAAAGTVPYLPDQSQGMVTQGLKYDSDKGLKFDADKPDLSLIPDAALEGIALAMMDGEKKYGTFNYKKGLPWRKLVAAGMRHLRAFNRGEDCAEDSKLNHLYHAAATVCMLIEYYEYKLGTDDRFKRKTE